MIWTSNSLVPSGRLKRSLEDAALEFEKAAGQIKAARQMDIPPKMAIPMRVLASIVAISCQLDAHVATRRIADEMVPGFANPDAVV